MEELLELKRLLLKGDIAGSLAIVEELEEMSRDDKINKITSYAIILLLHLIKQEAENRTTRSWDVSIRNCIRQIERTNKRRKSGGYYLRRDELWEVLLSAYPDAIDAASLEVEEGKYEPRELEDLADRDTILNRAIALILAENGSSR